MGTKNNPGNFDCYAKADPDEPIFVLLASDPLAPRLVRRWARLKEKEKGETPQIKEARGTAREMDTWQAEHPNE